MGASEVVRLLNPGLKIWIELENKAAEERFLKSGLHRDEFDRQEKIEHAKSRLECALNNIEKLKTFIVDKDKKILDRINKLKTNKQYDKADDIARDFWFKLYDRHVTGKMK